jgi:HSP90 family molecular chaperone
MKENKNMIYSKKQDVLTYLEKLPLIEGDFSKTFTISTETDQIAEWSSTSNEPSQEGFSFGTVEIDDDEIEVAKFTFSNTK